MSDSLYREAETRLREARADLVHQLGDLGADEAGELSGDVEFGDGFADAAAATAERTEVLGLVDSLRKHLEDVDRALARIAEGSYGVCARCGKQISPDRLKFRPEATLCVEDATSASK
jgi:DnaK suppressor protein